MVLVTVFLNTVENIPALPAAKAITTKNSITDITHTGFTPPSKKVILQRSIVAIVITSIHRMEAASFPIITFEGLIIVHINRSIVCFSLAEDKELDKGQSIEYSCPHFTVINGCFIKVYTTRIPRYAVRPIYLS